MSLSDTVDDYYKFTTRWKMNFSVQKWEFMTEVILSFFIVAITFESTIQAEFSVAAIAIIHSFNVARAFEAYKKAKVDHEQRK